MTQKRAIFNLRVQNSDEGSGKEDNISLQTVTTSLGCLTGATPYCTVRLAVYSKLPLTTLGMSKTAHSGV